ncbi:uncharacterized protein LOC117650651 [Thrips palmi]|uniref:Uncharacterized protein LOC117650651 n=1 Tax=Thrips palmi TaxID=161013 RepID=A0A6P8ZXG6_THRPL|nr:uncharacterized protein LOC117650651 [Thrips palmi]
MRAVSPRPQAWLAGDPLVSLLNMRVFMFRGMQDGDQLVLSARVVACLDRADCKTAPESCDSAGRGGRAKRSSEGRDGSNTTTSLEESFAFSVHVTSTTPHLLDGKGSVGDFDRTAVILMVGVLLPVLLVPAATAMLCHRKRTLREKAALTAAPAAPLQVPPPPVFPAPQLPLENGLPDCCNVPS